MSLFLQFVEFLISTKDELFCHFEPLEQHSLSFKHTPIPHEVSEKKTMLHLGVWCVCVCMCVCVCARARTMGLLAVNCNYYGCASPYFETYPQSFIYLIFVLYCAFFLNDLVMKIFLRQFFSSAFKESCCQLIAK